MMTLAPRTSPSSRPLGAVQRGQGGRAGDVRPRTRQPRQRDHLVGHQLGVGDLLWPSGSARIRAAVAPAACRGCGRYGPTPIMSRSSCGKQLDVAGQVVVASGRGCRSSRRCRPRSPVAAACRSRAMRSLGTAWPRRMDAARRARGWRSRIATGSGRRRPARQAASSSSSRSPRLKVTASGVSALIRRTSRPPNRP